MPSTEKKQSIEEAEASDKPSGMARKLFIPVNPRVEEAPTDAEGFEYANPVTLNNKLILYGNAVIEATDRLQKYTRGVEAAKLAKSKAERALEQYEGDLLNTYPPAKNLSTLKLIQAYLNKAAFNENSTAKYNELRGAVHKAEDDKAHWEAKASEIHAWLKAIETASQNIMTHLSYVKFGGGLSR